MPQQTPTGMQGIETPSATDNLEGAPASRENFDAEIGRKVARENAISKLWPLLGYALKDKLHATDPA